MGKRADQAKAKAEELADDAASVLDARGLDRADVYGHSMGGFIALTLALRRPELAHAMVDRVGPERTWLRAQLDEVGWITYPSVANFVLARIGTAEEAEDATDWLLRHGIVSRTFGPANPLRGHLRFTVRTREDDERLVAVAAAWQARRTA